MDTYKIQIPRFLNCVQQVDLVLMDKPIVILSAKVLISVANKCKLDIHLPTSLLSKYGIERLRIYVQGANLFTITNYKGLDPELPSQPDANG